MIVRTADKSLGMEVRFDVDDPALANTTPEAYVLFRKAELILSLCLARGESPSEEEAEFIRNVLFDASDAIDVSLCNAGRKARVMKMDAEVDKWYARYAATGMIGE